MRQNEQNITLYYIYNVMGENCSRIFKVLINFSKTVKSSVIEADSPPVNGASRVLLLTVFLLVGDGWYQYPFLVVNDLAIRM